MPRIRVPDGARGRGGPGHHDAHAHAAARGHARRAAMPQPGMKYALAMEDLLAGGEQGVHVGLPDDEALEQLLIDRGRRT